MGMYDTVASSLDGWVNTNNVAARRWMNASLLEPLIHLRHAQPAFDRINVILADAPSLVGGQISTNVSDAETEKLAADSHVLKSFADSIHYELDEMIDAPFTSSLESVMNDAYNLNPKNFRTKSNGIFGIKRGNSLEDLIVSTITDEQLKKDFKSKTEDIDNDKPEKILTDAIDDAKFWEKDFDKAAKIRDLQENFIEEHAEGWDDLDAEEKLRLLREYTLEVGKALDEKGAFFDFFRGDPIATDLRWYADDPANSHQPAIEYDPNNPITLNAWGYTRSGNKDGIVYINDAFGTGNPKDFDLDRALNTVTHEVRHQYQRQAIDDSSRYDTSEGVKNSWAPSSNTGTYATRPIEIDARAYAALCAV